MDPERDTERATESTRVSPWLAIGVTVGCLVIAAAVGVAVLSFFKLRELRRAPGGPPPAPRTQVTDYGSNVRQTTAFMSGMSFPGSSFEDRGRRLVTRRFGSPTALLRSFGFKRPAEVLGAGSLSIKGRKVYYQALLLEVPRPGGPQHLISTAVLVDCHERGATGAVAMSLRVPRDRPVGPGADLRGTPADPQYLQDSLELSSEQLCTFR
jgi:hypothetical protein